MQITVHWRIVRPLIGLVVFLSIAILYLYLQSRPPYGLYNTLTSIQKEESHKHVVNSRGKKYVMFKQLRGAGFNNQAQEILLFHHLSLLSSRVYVYQPLVWRPRGEESLVPLSAFLAGPTKGSISAAVFDEVCPESEITHVNLGAAYDVQWAHALEVLNGPERCVVVDDWIFNWEFLASSGIQSIWPTFQKYLVNHFEWSDYVLNIVGRAQVKLGLQIQAADEGEPYMALHLRRGDFESHCEFLSETQTGFTTWATLPILEASVLPPSLDTSNSSSIIEHCYPSLHRILLAITSQALKNPTIRTIHILHDGAWDHPSVYLQYYKLSAALTNANWATKQGWSNGPMTKVTHTADISIQWGEHDWAVGVDVELARRASVFIGNGYSSLTTQVVALRLGADTGRAEDITLV